MALAELIKAMQQQAVEQKQKEKELLYQIVELSDYETAIKAASIYAAEKHAYGFNGYLQQLSKLKKVLEAGVRPENALEAVDSCLSTGDIIKRYGGTK